MVLFLFIKLFYSHVSRQHYKIKKAKKSIYNSYKQSKYILCLLFLNRRFKADCVWI